MERTREEHVKTTRSHYRNKRRYTGIIATTTRGIKPFIYVLTTLILLTFVIAAPPFQQADATSDDGIDIEFAYIEYHKANTSLDFHVHLHNKSNGLIMNTVNIQACFLHLYRPSNGGHQVKNGGILITEEEVYDVDLEVEIAGGNFSELGQYDVYIYCQNGTWGDYVEFPIYVTKTGEELTTQITYSYYGSILVLILLIFGIVYIIHGLPSGDVRDDEEEIIDINWLKHLRPVLWGVIWFIALLISFIASNYTLMYLTYDLLGDVFFMVFSVMMYVTIIATPIYLVWLFYKMYRDYIVKKLIDRGVKMSTL